MTDPARRNLLERIRRQRSFRNDVIRYLRAEHAVKVHAQPDDLKLSDAIAARPSDILGLPEWVIRCYAGSEVRVSTWLHQTGGDADWDQAPFFAVIHHARGYELQDEIVSMPLSVFAAVLARLPAVIDPTKTEV